MRITQFRRHLDGYVVRVTDAQDIVVLHKHKDFIPLLTVKHIIKSGKKKCYNTLSAEFMFRNPKCVTFSGWKKQVWGILKYRKYKVR